LGGYDDWRLPTKDELLKVYEKKSKLKHIKNYSFWTSTEKYIWVWFVNLDSGYSRWSFKVGNNFLRCVR
jgi:hypothetical protein